MYLHFVRNRQIQRSEKAGNVKITEMAPVYQCKINGNGPCVRCGNAKKVSCYFKNSFDKMAVMVNIVIF